MKRAALLCVFLCLTFLSVVSAQQRRLDSVLALNNAYHKEDSLKAVYLRETFRAYYSVKNFARMDLYLDSAIQLASRLHNKSILAFIYFRAGGVNHNINKLRAITFYNRSVETALSCNAFGIAAGSYLNLGALYMDISDYPKSLEAHEQALRNFMMLKDEGGMSSCYMNMSSIYVTIGQYVKGMEYLTKALRVFESGPQPSYRGMAVAWEAMIEILFRSSDAELSAMGLAPAHREQEIAAALDKGLKAALNSSEDDPSLKSSFYRSYGAWYRRAGNMVLAEKNYIEAVTILQGDDTESSYSDNVRALGNFYIGRQEYAKGLGLLHNALAVDRKQRASIGEETSLNDLSRAHEINGHYDSALYYFRKAIVVKDSIYSKEREQEITRRQLKIDFDIKEREYKSAQQLSEARLREQEQQILLRNQQLQISDKEKTLQRLTFLQKQAEMESQKKLQAARLLQEQQHSYYETRTRDQQINMQSVQLTANRRVSIFLGVLALIVLAAALFILNSRRKTLQLNRIVSEQKAELEELVAVKDKIFSVVSHDMRTPVNNIIAFSSLLEDGDIEQERLAMYLEQIKGTLDHTSSLMENMLNWAASQMQGFRPVIENVNMRAVTDHIVAGVAPSLYKKKINCIHQIDSDVWVKGDRNMIELIVRNLLNNAIKFSHPHGAIEIRVESHGSELAFRVSDHGVGMSDEKVAQVNDGHSQALQTTLGTNREKGTGLGLMLCKHFAALMGGAIHLESKVGEGSCFTLTLPAV